MQGWDAVAETTPTPRLLIVVASGQCRRSGALRVPVEMDDDEDENVDENEDVDVDDDDDDDLLRVCE